MQNGHNLMNPHQFQSLSNFSFIHDDFNQEVGGVKSIAEQSRIQAAENVPVLRRRKYTKQHRKSLIIEPETSLILAGAIRSRQNDQRHLNNQKEDEGMSSTDNDIDDETRVQIDGHTLPTERRKFGAKRKVLKKRFFSTSNLKTDQNSTNLFDENTEDLKGEGKGVETQQIATKSLSVRDLNGDNIDFNNRDSVKKWTSQIFAELESIPNSRRQSMDVPTTLARSTILSPPEVIIDLPPTNRFSLKTFDELPEPAPRIHTLPHPPEIVGPNFLRDLLTATYPESVSSEKNEGGAASDTTNTQRPSRASSFEWLKNPEHAKFEDNCSSDEADREVARIGMPTTTSSVKTPEFLEKRKKNYEELEKSVHELENLGNASWFPPPPPPIEDDYEEVMGEYQTLPTSFRKRRTEESKSNRSGIGSIYENANSLNNRSIIAPQKPFSLENLPMIRRLNEINNGAMKTENKEIVKKQNNFSDFALQLAERDAQDACSWLRKAGFSKYAEQFDEGKLPIQVGQEDKRLEPADLRSLNRRVSILNRCHAMKVDSVPMRRRMNNEFPRVVDPISDIDSSSPYSENWRQYSNTWHRPSDHVYTGSLARNSQRHHQYTPPQQHDHHHPMNSTERKVQRTDWYEASAPSQGRLPRATHLENDTSSTTAMVGGDAAAKLQRSQSERIKDRARAIMKKMDLRSNSKRPKESRSSRPAPMNIGDPVLVSYDTPKNSIRSHHIDRPSILPERGRSVYQSGASQSRSKSIAQNRRGLVFLTPTSPDSDSYGFSDATSSVFSGRSEHRRRELSMPPPTRHRVNNGYGTGPSSSSSPSTNPYHHLITSNQQPSDGTLRRRELMPFDSYLYPGHTNFPEIHMNNNRFPPPPLEKKYEDPEDPKMTDDPSNINMFNDGYYTHEIKTTSVPRHHHHHLNSGGATSTTTSSTMTSSSINNNNNNNNTTNGGLLISTNLKIESDENPKLTRRSDSGLGSSLSRSPSGPHTQRIRHSRLPYPSSSASFLGCSWTKGSGGLEEPLTDIELARSIDSLNLIEMSRLRRTSYLRLMAILEKSTDGGGGKGIHLSDPESDELPQSKQAWSVQRLIKRMKISDAHNHHHHHKSTKDSEDLIFGVGLDTIFHRTGYFLPRPILEIMQFLRSTAPETVGIFRKNGVKSRIAELRGIIDKSHGSMSNDVFIGENSLDSTQVHDAADVLKQYLRDLPEPLMTVKMSEVFANICSSVPDVDRLSALQYAIVLLPDENREALKTLLLFLKDVSKSSQVNNMTAQNLSVCFTPSLFQLGASRLDKITPASRRHKTVGATGLPSEKEMKEARACQLCLTMLIEYALTVFMVPDCVDEHSDTEDDNPILTDLGLKGPRSFLVDRVIDMIRDHSDTWKSWTSEGSFKGIEMFSKRPTDSHPLKTFRVWIDIPSAPKSVMMRILKERHMWDTSIINWRHLEYVSAPDTDIHQYVQNETIGHPTRDSHLARFHSSGLTEIRGACAVAERSVKCTEDQLLGGVSATVFDQRFLIEPIGGGQSRVNFIARVDLKGRSLQWYNKSFATIMCRQMDRLRESFQNGILEKNGPETNV